MKRNERGFTLVELLAVIVILGLLMAISIPSVTKYITQSRVKTLISSMDSYVTAVVTQVNNGEYKFSDSTKVFAIPIECIALEKGGTNPFGNWYQANSNYWAYVLVHYDNVGYTYEYGFTFKDDAGYGLYPTINSKITNSMVKTGYDDLNQPEDGLAIEFVSIEKWEGFKNINSSTELVVLEAETEGFEGDGKDTCTLCQKGDNYDAVEAEKLNNEQKLTKLIKANNPVINANPTLTKPSNQTSDQSGLYASNATNSGGTTYYFRGNVTNNYVKFANLRWKIIRINEDGSVRIILDDHIGKNVNFVLSYTEYNNMYYSNGTELKKEVDSWYESKIKNTGFDSYVVTGSFCEEAKVKGHYSYNGSSANVVNVEDYNADFRCKQDGNGKGPLSLKVGLITYEEALYAGGYNNIYNKEYYLGDKRFSSYTMSPSGIYGSIGRVWGIGTDGFLSNIDASSLGNVRPVINLSSSVKAIGTGTKSDPYVIKTN